MGIKLEKGNRISLTKPGEPPLTNVTLGLGWDAAGGGGGFLGGIFGGGGGSIDLDASCLMFDDNGRLVDEVWFRQLSSRDGSIRHSGDNRTGAGDGDDETIKVDLSRIPANVKTLVFTVNSFTGQSFESVKNAYVRLVNDSNGQEVARYDLSCAGDHTGQVMCRVYRHDGGWKMHAIGENATGRTFQDMMPQIAPHI